MQFNSYLNIENKVIIHNGQLRNTHSNLNSPIKIISPVHSDNEQESEDSDVEKAKNSWGSLKMLKLASNLSEAATNRKSTMPSTLSPLTRKISASRATQIVPP